MADIKEYGDLDDKELLEFLAEIKSGDEDIEEAEANADEKIDNEEAQSMLSELPENAEIEAYYGDDAWRMDLMANKGQQKVAEKLLRKKLNGLKKIEYAFSEKLSTKNT